MTDPKVKDIILELQALLPQFQDLQKTRQAIVNRAMAACRRHAGGDKEAGRQLYGAIKESGDAPPQLLHVLVMQEQVAMLQAQINPRQRRMEALAKSLPVAGWVESQRGFGHLNLAKVVACAGDLSDYSNPSQLWKRFGLGRFVHGGEWLTQRRFANRERAILAGFNPMRRAVAACLAESLVKGNRGDMKAAYDAKKAEYMARGWDAQKVPGDNRANKAAKRYLVKRALRELWREWNRA